jgi:hypothetical protein
LSQTNDRLEAELNRTSADSMVEAELSRIRGELSGSTTTAKQLGARTETAQGAPAQDERPAEETPSAPAQEEQR